MKKYIFYFICSLLLILPCNGLAKKVTCSNGDYNATIELDKEKFNIGDTASISITSNHEYETIYRVGNKDILEVNENGIIKASKEGTATISTEIDFIQDEAVVGSCKVDLSVEVLSNDSLLKSLTLEELDISEVFEPDKYVYEITLPYKYEKINIIAEANNANAKITGDGRRYLNEGNNEYEVIVTATDGTTTTYKIVIIREEANSDATLNNLIVEGYVLTPKFDKNIYKYSLNVDKSVEKITINAFPTYDLATVQGIGTFTLATGANLLNVIVIAENGTEETYEITVNRNNGSSKLESLSIKGIELDKEFLSDIFIYQTTINSNIKKLDISAKAVDDDQIEILGNENLKYGNNEIIIRVTGKDKSTTTYKVIVNKLSVEEENEIEQNDLLLKILFVIFIISIIVMIIFIVLFLKRNYKTNRKFKKIVNKKK